MMPTIDGVHLASSVRRCARRSDDTDAPAAAYGHAGPGVNPAAPSLEYLFDSRSVTYNWPCHIGVSFHCDLRKEGLMSDHPTALGGTCSGRFDPPREQFKMRRLCACLTVIA